MEAMTTNQLNRMFEVRIKNAGEKPSFKLPVIYGNFSYSYQFYKLGYEKPAFCLCDICMETFAESVMSLRAGAFICDDCKKDHLMTCSLCNSFMLDIDDIKQTNIYRYDAVLKYNRTVRINDKEKYICLRCKSDKFTVCTSCKTLTENSKIIYTYTGDYCQKCIDEKFTRCKGCRNYTEKDQIIDGLCKTCFITTNEKQTAEVRGYSTKPEPVFISLVGDSMTKFFGCEYEFDNGFRTPELMRYLAEIKEIYLKEDGSLTGNYDRITGDFQGFEMVTYPLDLKYHKKLMKYTEIAEKLKNAGYKAHDAKNKYGDFNAGYHIHLNKTAFGESPRNQSKFISYFLHLFMKFERELKIFSRRTEFSYCSFYTGYNINGKMTREKQKYEYYNQHERNLCVNLKNTHTVEIRLLRGTMDRTTIISGMELITVMVDMVLNAKTEEKVRLITWNDLKNAIPRDFVDLKAYLSKKNL